MNRVRFVAGHTLPRSSTVVEPFQILVPVLCRIDTLDEIEYFKNGGILHYVLRNLAA